MPGATHTACFEMCPEKAVFVEGHCVCACFSVFVYMCMHITLVNTITLFTSSTNNVLSELGSFILSVKVPETPHQATKAECCHPDMYSPKTCQHFHNSKALESWLEPGQKEKTSVHATDDGCPAQWGDFA